MSAPVLEAKTKEMIQAAAIALWAGMTISDLTNTLFPCLTQVEDLKLAALAFEWNVEQISSCAG